MSRAEIFSEYRPLLFSIAYRMLGSVMDAEDMVQETYLRFEQAVQSEVQSPKSFLATIVTRLCIDHLRLAYIQRESYVGPWLPEPLQTGPGSGFTEHAALADSLSIAFLVLLESLSPVERAVFLLREVFDYDYEEVARIVEKSEANCRQIGNSGFEEGRFLTKFASQVDIVEFAPQVKASQLLQDKVAEMPNMTVTVNHAVKKFKTEYSRLKSVVVQDRATGELKEWQYDGVFVFIGLSPNNDLVKDKVETDRFGFVMTDSDLMTTLPGLFAAGDVRLGSTKQAASAAGEGATAALMIREYLKGK